MRSIIDPIDKILLLSELNDRSFLRKTNYGDNHLFIVDYETAPNTLLEIGRLREVSFRAGGGGTGLDCDIDEFDTAKNGYKQLVVWDPIEQEIIGGYRFIRGDQALMEDGSYHLSTTELFDFSDEFKKDYLPKTIELGRSFVQPNYQPKNNSRKGIFSMDNLWDGLGGITVQNPDIEYFFGKVTMYTNFNQRARDLILAFMSYYFPCNDNLVSAKPGIKCNLYSDIQEFLKEINGLPYKQGHLILNHKVRDLGENIPPLFNAYMNLSATMRVFDTAVNSHFGDVEETGILVTIADIYQAKKDRHINSFFKDK